MRRNATVVLALAAAGLLAAPPVAHVAGATDTDRAEAPSDAAAVDEPEGPTAPATPSPFRIVAPADPSPVVFATESNALAVILGQATAGTALVVLDAPCPYPRGRPKVYGLDTEGRQLTSDAEAKQQEGSRGPRGGDLVFRRAHWPPRAPDEGLETTGPCALNLIAQVAIDDPATGWVTVRAAGRAGDVPGQVRPYRVARGSDAWTFGIMVVVAVMAGALGVVRFLTGPMVRHDLHLGGRGWKQSLKQQAARYNRKGQRRKWGRTELTLPVGHPLRGGSWVTSLAAFGAAATPLLAATGALSELAPQYQTGKVVVGNVLVVTLLAIAAALLPTGGDEATVKPKLGYATAAVFVAVSAVAAQVLLTGLVLLHASQHGFVRIVTAGVAIIAVGAVALTVQRPAAANARGTAEAQGDN